MPRIEICNPSTQVLTEPYDAIQSHQTAAEALTNLSYGSNRTTCITNDPNLAKRFPNTVRSLINVTAMCLSVYCFLNRFNSIFSNKSHILPLQNFTILAMGSFIK